MQSVSNRNEFRSEFESNPALRRTVLANRLDRATFHRFFALIFFLR